MGHKNLNIPNLLTILRLLMVPVIVALMNPLSLVPPTPAEAAWAAGLFTIAFLTDWLDGYWARKYNLVTPLGEFLDPLADKIVFLCPLVALVPHGWAPGWVVSVLMFREFAVTGLRAVAAEQGLRINSTTSGRSKTVYQFASCMLLLLHYRLSDFTGSPPPVPDVNLHAVGLVLLYVATGFTLYSGVKYFVSFIRADAASDI